MEVNVPAMEVRPEFTIEMRPSDGEELSLQDLYERCAPTIVSISAYKEGKMGYSWGSGVIISGDGLILTNCHVLENCDSAVVTLPNGIEYDALLVGADTISDVALLKIEASGLAVAELGDSNQLRVGDRVAAIGNPLGEAFRNTLTDGIISAIERGMNYQGRSMTLLQTNTAINEGNSGGALFNLQGQVIGITNMKMMSSYSSIEGITPASKASASRFRRQRSVPWSTLWSATEKSRGARPSASPSGRFPIRLKKNTPFPTDSMSWMSVTGRMQRRRESKRAT